MKIKNIFDKVKEKNIIVVGDSMLDSYVMGDVNRNSPEAPVPIVDIIDEKNKLGGAANVALNLKSLGINPILITVIGDDKDGINFIKLLRKNNLNETGIFIDSSRKTTNKKRIIVNKKHLMRIDNEDRHLLNNKFKKKILTKIKQLSSHSEIIILQDYNKGVLGKELIDNITSAHQEKFISVDPKKENFFDYKNINLFKPNRKELLDAYNSRESSINEIINLSSNLKHNNNIENILITLSEDGLIIHNQSAKQYKTNINKIIDVSGAGDTVISLATILFYLNLPERFIAEMCNLAGGIACMNSGVTAINLKELIKNAERNNLDLYL